MMMLKALKSLLLLLFTVLAYVPPVRGDLREKGISLYHVLGSFFPIRLVHDESEYSTSNQHILYKGYSGASYRCL